MDEDEAISRQCLVGTGKNECHPESLWGKKKGFLPVVMGSSATRVTTVKQLLVRDQTR